MVSIDEALSEFIDDWNAGRRPQVDDALERVAPQERAELADQLMTWLEIAPAPAFDEATVEAIRGEPAVAQAVAAMGSEAGMWPVVLPRLRERARLSVSDLSARLVAALGLAGREAKTAAIPRRARSRRARPVAGIPHSARSTRADPADCSARTRGRDRTDLPSRRPCSARQLRRLRRPQPTFRVLTDMLTSKTSAEEWDEVDQLFQGGR